MDSFLKERLDRYDRWLAKGEIDLISQVVPMNQALPSKQWVLPTKQVEEILENARIIAVTDCACRTHYNRCDYPKDVCLIFDQEADEDISNGIAKSISKEEALSTLKRAHEHGLVHLSLYRPDHRIFALCSCCSCCCHDLQMIQITDRDKIAVHSQFVVETDMDACTHCGICVDRCHFNARLLESDKLVERLERCTGCSLCVTTCPEKAIVLKPR